MVAEIIRGDPASPARTFIKNSVLASARNTFARDNLSNNYFALDFITRNKKELLVLCVPSAFFR